MRSALNWLRLSHDYRTVSIFFASGMLILAQTAPKGDFAAMIRTPASLQKTLEYCDGDSRFETALANWLEAAEPSSPADREAVHKASLRLLEDTTDGQLVLSLIDGLLRHALEDIRRDQAVAPVDLALSLWAEIGRAVRGQRFKIKAAVVPASGLADDGAVKEAREAGFLEKFLNLAEPRVAHTVTPVQRREQAERKNSGPAGRRLLPPR